MGSTQKVFFRDEDYVSLEEAAKYLGKSTREIRLFVMHGVLRTATARAKQPRISRDDLYHLKDLLDRGYQGAKEIRETLLAINVKLASMSKNMDFLMHINGMDVSILRDAPLENLLSIYEEIHSFLEVEEKHVTRDIMTQWGMVFLQFTEIEFNRLVDPTVDLQPWKPFHKLCIRFMRMLRQKKGFSINADDQHTYRLLEKARKRLVQAAVVMEGHRAIKFGPSKLTEISQLDMTGDSLDRFIAAEAVNLRIV